MGTRVMAMTRPEHNNSKAISHESSSMDRLFQIEIYSQLTHLTEEG